MIEPEEVQPKIVQPPNIQEIIRKGRDIYDRKKAEIEPENNGKYVVIETDSEDYFIGDTRDEATVKAKEKFPDKIMFIKIIGPAEESSRSFSSSRFNYARHI